ncbi:MAG: O-antigen ligase family protein [Gaiella sp.]|nr:O-antigen ligase family protein [Gaiella sp.]
MSRRFEPVELSRQCAAILPGLLLTGIFIYWAYHDGGYAVVDWAPGALFALALVVVLLGVGPVRSMGRSPALAIGLLTAFTAWSFLTIAWAEVPADAWTGANRTLLYLCVFTVFVLQPWRPRGAATIVGAYALGIFTVALLSFLQTVERSDPSESFRFGRLASPIAYTNAICALYMTAALAALHLAARREVPVVLRGVFLAAAGSLAQLSLLTQSRGSLVAVPAALAVYFTITTGRARSLMALLAVAVAVVPTISRLLDVYEVVLADEDATDVLVRARAGVLWSAVALFIAGSVAGLLDRRVRIAARRAAVVRRSIGVVAVTTLVITICVALLSVADPVDRAGAAWEHFRKREYVTDPATPHLTSGFGSGRYELWTIALHQFRDNPVYGVGGDNYAVAYLRERNDQAQPLYPHSVVLRTLSQTGIVGTALLLGFLVAAAVSIWPRLRRGTAFARGIVGIATTLFAYWLIHGSVEWFWEIPALGAPAFAFLGLASRTSDADAEQAGTRPRARSTSVAMAGSSIVAVAAFASLALPWLSARDVDAAVAAWRSDAAAAYQRLDRARWLNPLTDEPDVVESVIASLRHEEPRQERALRAALRRNPLNWYPMVELAALETRRANFAGASAWLDRAESLNPREETIELLRSRIAEGRPVTSSVLRGVYARQASLLTGERQEW